MYVSFLYIFVCTGRSRYLRYKIIMRIISIIMMTKNAPPTLTPMISPELSPFTLGGSGCLFLSTTHTEGAIDVLQMYPLSMAPVLLHPSPSTMFPSSHASHPSTTPFPITGGHDVSIVTHDDPHHTHSFFLHFSYESNLAQ